MRYPHYALHPAPKGGRQTAWIGARATVGPGVTVRRNAILTVGSVATKEMEAGGIYQGVPARKIRERKIKQQNNLLTGDKQ